jgi:hypothetical protein
MGAASGLGLQAYIRMMNKEKYIDNISISLI